MFVSFSFFFFFFFFFLSFASSSSFNATHKCSPQQSLDLLLFKENMSSINDSGDYCKRWLGDGYHPIMMNWNENTDCCKWGGITCNHFTGDVIGIDLSCGMLRGTIHPNTTLFHLPHLQTLNLAFNKFSPSQLPREIGGLSKSLTLLNLSHSGFSSDIPGEILYLSKLVFLDLSYNYGLKIQPSVLKNLLRNFMHLRELLLSEVDISWVLPRYLNISTSLKSLYLSNTSLQGKLPDNIFSLHYLEKLDMSNNDDITGPWPIVKKRNNIPLKWLDLSGCGLVGSIPKSLVNLRQLTILDLSFNKLNGTLPSLLFTLPCIEYIILSGNMLSGGLPSEFFNCRSLKTLSLSVNNFDGKINGGSTPTSFTQLSSLTHLDLSHNNFIGLWDLSALLLSLPNLEILSLSYSGLIVVSNNNTRYVNHKFQDLRLASCNLHVFPESLRALNNLAYLDLSSNNIHGRIPDWAQEIGGNGLRLLDLSNNFITSLHARFQWGGLHYVYLQSNQIKGPFPPSICSMSNLMYLDISNNSFDGVLPQCLGNITSSLEMVDMGNNDFHGIIPNVYECGRLQGLIMKGNRLHGEVPSSLSKCQSLKVLDLGNNQLNGTFPGWLGVLPLLQVLVLKSNKFYGSIETPSTLKSAFPSLRVLVLSHNRFKGIVPQKYFQNFNAMKNVVKNNTQPHYLSIGNEYYSMSIVVKGVEQVFTKLFVGYTIVDLSNNSFEGDIPDVIGHLSSLKVLNLSHNSLSGQIPNALGNLLEIESLDLSCNQLTGNIPQTLADIASLEVLNLSQNHLKGRIPSGRQFNTFGTSFEGNPKLCGFPLQKTCEPPHEPQFEADGDGDGESGLTWRVVMLGFGCGTLIGLVMGYVMLSTRTPKWFNAIADAGEHVIQTNGNKRIYVYIGR